MTAPIPIAPNVACQKSPANKSNQTVPPKEPIVEYQEGEIISGRFKLLHQLGRGAFGVVYETIDLKTMKAYAIKLELHQPKEDEPGVALETGVLKRLQFSPHFTRFVQNGQCKGMSYLVMQLVGKNLNYLRRACPQQTFTIGSAVRLSFQCFEAIEAVHSADFLHRDIKPHNYAMGREPPESRTVYLLDFGLVRRYRFKGSVRQPRPRTAFRGTVKYASHSVMCNQDAGRQDDLISWIYMLVEFLKGELPWHEESERSKISLMKLTCGNTLFEHTPPQVQQIYNLLIPLSVTEQPPYLICKAKLQELMCRSETRQDDPFDWEQGGKHFAAIKHYEMGRERKSDLLERQEKPNQMGYTTDLTETVPPS